MPRPKRDNRQKIGVLMVTFSKTNAQRLLPTLIFIMAPFELFRHTLVRQCKKIKELRPPKGPHSSTRTMGI